MSCRVAVVYFVRQPRNDLSVLIRRQNLSFLRIVASASPYLSPFLVSMVLAACRRTRAISGPTPPVVVKTRGVKPEGAAFNNLDSSHVAPLL